MSHSLNEFQALVKKAVHGAGLEWGVASEVARAAKLQAQQGEYPVQSLLECLQFHHQHGAQAGAPAALSDVWCGAQGVLSPLITGLCLCDCARALPSHMEGVMYPELLSGFVALVNAQRSQPLDLDIQDGVVSLTQAGARTVERNTRIHLATPELLALEQWAHRTYAPATEASRAAGAGSGLSDND